ncbi:alpha/beta hydrolase [Cellulomonas fimi]|uniref:alpha/beta fold hydrolase n=1 Tax=Cellulomonas sp. RIT-PI-Y TaxID=3035297 RepID=UPI0021D97A84
MFTKRHRRYVVAALIPLFVIGLVGVAVLVENARTAAGREARPMPGELVDVGGHRLHLVVQGTGGPTVVLEAGSGEVASGWQQVAGGLSTTTTVVSYDRAGTAWSEAADEPRTASAVVSDLRTALREIDAPRPYVLVGHSLGGLYIREYARLHPDEVAGLVLVDARPEDDAARTAALLPDGAGTSSWPTWIPTTLKATGALRVGGGALLDGLVPAEYREEFLDVTASPTYFATQRDEADRIGATEAALRGQDLGDLPVRVIARGLPQDYAAAGIDTATGRELERLWQDGQRRMLSLSSDSTLVVAEHSGHLIPREQPDLVVAEVASLLDDLRGPG